MLKYCVEDGLISFAQPMLWNDISYITDGLLNECFSGDTNEVDATPSNNPNLKVSFFY